MHFRGQRPDDRKRHRDNNDRIDDPAELVTKPCASVRHQTASRRLYETAPARVQYRVEYHFGDLHVPLSARRRFYAYVEVLERHLIVFKRPKRRNPKRVHAVIELILEGVHDPPTERNDEGERIQSENMFLYMLQKTW